MKTSFHFAQTPQIIFGIGKIAELGGQIKQFGNRLLLVTGSNSFKSSAEWEGLQEQFDLQELDSVHVSITGEPTPDQIDQVCDEYSDQKIEVVVGIGGGSVLDAGKAISAMLNQDARVKSFMEGVGTQTHDGSKVPFIAVPTTSGTGSEATKNAVLSEVGAAGFKKSLRHDNFVPNVALIDPALTLNCPKSLTANSGMDAFTQLLESYLSTKANIMTDSLAIKGLGCIRDYLERVVYEGNDLEARSGMAYASFASGLTLANAGLGTVHGMAGAIGGYFSMPHGAICGTLMSEVNNQTVKKLRSELPESPALNKYAKVGRLFSQKAHKSDDFHIDYLLELIEKWSADFELPKLSAYGISNLDFERIIDASGNKNNPVALSKEEMHEILSMRF